MIAARNGRVLAFDNLALDSVALRCPLPSGHRRRLRDPGALRQYRGGDLRGAETSGAQRHRGVGDARRPPRSMPRHQPAAYPRRHRRTERALWAEFECCRSPVLGALLDAVAGASGRLAEVEIATPPRMADFAEWMVAAEPKLGWSDGTFLGAYCQNRDAANEITLEASPVVQPLRDLTGAGGFEGAPSDLLALLDSRVEDSVRRLRSWPRTPRSLSVALDRLAPSLRAAGISIERWREPGGNRARRIAVRDASVPSVPEGKICRSSRDARDAGDATKAAPSGTDCPAWLDRASLPVEERRGLQVAHGLLRGARNSRMGGRMTSQLLNAKQVADLLGVKASWVYAETRAGRMPHVLVGRYRRYRVEAIEAWVGELERGPVPTMPPAQRRTDRARVLR